MTRLEFAFVLGLVNMAYGFCLPSLAHVGLGLAVVVVCMAAPSADWRPHAHN